MAKCRPLSVACALVLTLGGPVLAAAHIASAPSAGSSPTSTLIGGLNRAVPSGPANGAVTIHLPSDLHKLGAQIPKSRTAKAYADYKKAQRQRTLGAVAAKPPCKVSPMPPPPPSLATGNTTQLAAAKAPMSKVAQVAFNDCDKLTKKITAAMAPVIAKARMGGSGMGMGDAKNLVGELKKMTIFVIAPDGRKIKVMGLNELSMVRLPE